MGVHGLTGYINKQPSLPTTLILPVESSPTPPTPEEAIPFIIDGLALTYHLGLLDPLRGGQYVELARIIRKYIEWWRACGLEPEFVWDGPFDSAKLPTVIGRSSQSLARTITYMKSGDGARLQGPLKKAASRLPPFTHQVMSMVLEEMGVASHCAEGEGDSPTAELAQRRNGYVVSNDSDYFIFNSQCRGYVPLHSIGYGSTNDPRLERVATTEPPRMQFLVFDHRNLAKSLHLPPSHLPILAALIGNDLVDFASEICLPKKRHFPGRVEPQEILRIAKALSRFSSFPAATLPQLQDIIFSVLPILLPRPSKDFEIITKLAVSAYSYRLLPLSIPTPSFPLNPRPSDNPTQAASRAMYYSAYKASRLSSFNVHVLKHKTVCLQGPLEMPEFQSPVIYLGRPLRQIVYSVLDHTIGIESPTNSIIEYCRRGEQMTPTSVPILPFTSYLPRDFPPLINDETHLLSLPPETRFQLYLYLLRLPLTLSPSPLFPIIASLTHLILHCPSSRQWRTHQLLCATLTASLLIHSPPQFLSNLPRPKEPPVKLHLHLSAELLTCLVWINTLGGTLLLDSEWKGTNWKNYDGKIFHGLLGMKGDETKVWQFVRSQTRIVREEVEGIMKFLEGVRAEAETAA
ncbi:uncharacterized protein JCM6883_006639 [Sporobolomyces salmoneus]|uniref:uncharacterized protein n=1 Tax=Sporobolomyces salmoneus TaxID=183962 RepID=UPI0031826BDD